MNLALHGFLLQVFVSILNIRHGSLLCSAGEPGYLDFDNLPETNFSCQGKVIGGYYADVEAGCQMFHVCTIGQKDEIMDIKFLCLNGTVFDQETRVCERVDEVDCSKSERFYNLNLELYGNNAVTLSLHESEDDEDQSELVDDHQQRTTSARPKTTSTTSTTTLRPSISPTTPSSSSFAHPTGYPQHFQPQPPFPQVHTSQSKSLYDDKNGGYHHQYIFHNGERTNSQATSYQLFSNQGVSSTTVQAPQVHQIRYSSTASPHIIHNEPSTVSPIYHTSSTIQTLLNSNVNGPALINPIFHNHGIASTTEQFIRSNNPRETSEYRDSSEQSIRPLEAVQSTNKGKVSKLTISPVPTEPEPARTVQSKTSQGPQQQRISSNFLPTPPTIETTIRSFYPTPRTSSKPTQTSQTPGNQVTQHIHVPPPVQIPQIKPQQITINLPPPDIQRIVQNPSPLLPSQSRVIVTAKASVSDESGRPLNTTQLVTLPLPTIPASYDDYKEGDESFDPFYRDVPKIRSNRRVAKSESKKISRKRRSPGQRIPEGTFVYDADREEDLRVLDIGEEPEQLSDFRSLKESLMKFRKILFSDEVSDESIDQDPSARDADDASSENVEIEKPKSRNRNRGGSSMDLDIGASRYSKSRKYEEAEYESEDNVELESSKGEVSKMNKTEKKVSDTEDDIPVTKSPKRQSRYRSSMRMLSANNGANDHDADMDKNSESKRVLDVVILGTNEHTKMKSGESNATEEMKNEEIIDEESTEASMVLTTEETTAPTVQDTTEIDRTTETILEVESTSVRSRNDGSRNNEMAHGERKPGSRKISARIRSRGKMVRRKHKSTTTSTTSTTTTEMPETTYDEAYQVETTIIPPIRLDSNVEEIESHMFDEVESQTPKGLDTRAIDHPNKNSVKLLENGKPQDKLKHDRKSESTGYEKAEKRRSDSNKLDANNLDRSKDSEKNSYSKMVDQVKGNVFEEPVEEKLIEEKEITTTELPKTKGSHRVKENITIEHKESVNDKEIAIKESSKGLDSEKNSFHEVKESSRHGKSMKFEDHLRETSNHRQDKSMKLKDDDIEEEEEGSTKLPPMTTMENGSSIEETSEYHDFTESSFETTHEVSVEDEYKEIGSPEDSTVSSEEDNSEEVSSSREIALDSSTEGERSVTEEENEEEENVGEDSTEGVLKFTDELPKIEKKEESTESRKLVESTENIAQDYVDDNYEPENYKQHEYSTESNDLSDEKLGKNHSKYDSKENDEGKDDSFENTTATSAEEEEEDDENEDEKFSSEEREEKSSVEESRENSEEEEEEMTVFISTTTTIRPTPPKLFKPISARKSYNYIPPTTTPNPVIIKPRLPLLNPKPAKPPKTYNDLAPKPVIRRLPLPTRKYLTSTGLTLPREKYDKMELKTESTSTTTESSRSVENILESKLETKEQDEAPAASSKNETSINTDDQQPSPTEQKAPANMKNETEEMMNKTFENFTPYPISKLTTLASTIEETLKQTNSTTTEEDTNTTAKSFSLMDVNIITTSSPSPVPITTEASIETTTKEEQRERTIDVIFEEKMATESPIKSPEETTEEVMEETTERIPDEVSEKVPEKLEEEIPETTMIPETSSISTTSTSTSSKVPESENSGPMETTTIRLIHRKLSSSKRHASFNCLEKEMYRFYGDKRDCRLFHYCSPGFTSRQVLDFRFVCEEGTAFDEESQSCRHDVRGRKCQHKSW